MITLVLVSIKYSSNDDNCIVQQERQKEKEKKSVNLF